jgi:hypothetical protein
MHHLTDNNEFSVTPRDGKWVAHLIFYASDIEDEETAEKRTSANGHDYWIDTAPGIETVHISVTDSSPSTALAKLWAVCDDEGFWAWNGDTGLPPGFGKAASLYIPSDPEPEVAEVTVPFRGVCRLCEGWIEEGSVALHVPGKGMTHKGDCPNP